jgi:N-methylhydantoinase A
MTRFPDMRVATDVGGTFTDIVFCRVDQVTGEVGDVITHKSDTTPPNFEQGVMNAIAKAKLDLAEIAFFAHGSTVVINALTERKGSRTALITTRGFRDVLEIARGNRPDVFNFHFQKPAPFVPRALRFELTERIGGDGEVVTPVQLGELPSMVEALRREEVEAIAICFLHSYANPFHEKIVRDEIQRLWPEVSVVASHEICREWREYERTSTTVLAAYVHPVANGYLDRLESGLDAAGFGGKLFVMQSNGGIASVRAARANPVALVESGPASGMLGAVALGRMIGEQNMIALDIGGTTAKCTLIEDGGVQLTTDYKIEWTRTNAGYPIKTPVVDLVEIGNGGGSIAWLDDGGRMHVGPKSAGAMPGPACYGKGGTEPTTTDANLLLGRIDADNLLGGEIRADLDAVRRAFDKLAGPLGVTPEDVARGIIRIANANMVNALKLVSVNRGHDPREFAMIAFGGGGAMHAVMLANELQMPKVIIPTNPSVFSAWGMLLTDLRRDYLRTQLRTLDEPGAAAVETLFNELAVDAARDFAQDGVAEDRLVFERFAELRYVGQEHGVRVRVPGGLVPTAMLAEASRIFHDAHEREYTFRMDSPIEIVNAHLVAYAMVGKANFRRREAGTGSAQDALRKHRHVDFDEHGIHETPIYMRARLLPGMALRGPAIIEEAATVIVIPPHNHAEVDAYGNVVVRREQ